MIIDDESAVTPAVMQAFAKAPDARVRELTQAFARHMHAFAREVRLSEKELEFGVEFLNRIGKTTTETRNEGVLASDAIGLSTLVCLLNNGASGASETAAALLGPFWRMNSPPTASGESIVRSETPGDPLFAFGKVVDASGRPVADAEVDVWHSSPNGFYENQDDSQIEHNLRGKFTTDAEGRFSFRSVMPAGYPIPTDGPIGDLVLYQGRRPYRPAHLHFLIFKQGFKTLVTQVFVAEDEDLQDDVVFGVTSALVGDYKRHGAGAPDPSVKGPWRSLDYTFHLEAGKAELPKPPIK